jgi:hypothetical protein
VTSEIKTKTSPAFIVTSQGTALGTSSIIDTSGWMFIQLMAQHGGTGGSRTITVYANGGTIMGTSATAMPDLVFIGSANSDQAGAGSPVFTVGSLTNQAVVAMGTSSNASYKLSYMLFD